MAMLAWVAFLGTGTVAYEGLCASPVHPLRPTAAPLANARAAKVGQQIGDIMTPGCSTRLAGTPPSTPTGAVVRMTVWEPGKPPRSVEQK